MSSWDDLSLPQRLTKLLTSTAYFVLLQGIRAVCSLTAPSRARRRSARGGAPARRDRHLRVLTIGTFYHPNWYRGHLGPLADARLVLEVRVVTGLRGEPLPGITWCVPPPWLRSVFGTNLCRAVLSLWVALRWRPDVVIGYFIFPNALWALVLARLVGAWSGYQMCGGPHEVARCGAASNNPFLNRQLPGYPGLQAALDRVTNQFDVIVVRGERARRFCQATFTHPKVYALSAGVDDTRFCPHPDGRAEYDVVTVGRLCEVKRFDIFLKAFAEVVRARPEARAVIVGDGPDRAALRQLSRELGLDDHVEFAGTRDDVESFLARSRVFVLTSASEGLSIALAEAMASGLPAVVSHVGDLGELVKDEENGFLVRPGDIGGFASAILTLLTDERRRMAYADRAAQDAYNLCSAKVVRDRWSDLLTEVTTDAPPRSRAASAAATAR